ncbi:competence protein ComEC [Bradyrhizobium sp. 44]|uniref:competence protein ComEC n=1 Tax=Bradyrhizobium sp. 44 TaxID=2782675 RepID=UPI001FFA5867|nr:competence protein ComEC [Bradyrhizobium sp. 44]MCK1285436.1 competence protein ComEC [Bradyrhizobium sp. 44]
MADFYELDFLPVHTSKSGDCITIRYSVGGAAPVLHVIDGGYTSTAPDLASHIDNNHGIRYIDHVVVTHPDKDHAEGLAPILENFQVGTLWMLRPWIYADQLIQHFPRMQSVANLQQRLRDDYPYIATLEEIAVRRGFNIQEPFQGKKIGAFTVLAPSPVRYGQLILRSDRTPQLTPGLGGILSALAIPVKAAVRMLRDSWGSERFSSEETSVENEMSVVQFANIAGDNIVLTGDAGRDGMNEAADYAPNAGLFLPGVKQFQVPHHGGRRNLSTEVCDRWLGPRLPTLLPAGSETFHALISSAKEDTDHPRKAVIRAMRHRGAFVATTEDTAFRAHRNSPSPWPGKLTNIPYPDEQEVD